ncbi:hypothetical protein [Sporosarcina sp. ITBMC105]
MFRIMILALFIGSISSMSAISLWKGFDMEGVAIGLLTITLVFGIMSLFYVNYKKQIVHS